MKREKNRKLRAELEEAKQSRKYALAKQTKYRGAGGTIGEAEENNGGRSNSTKDSIREHREESADKHMSKSTGFPNTDGRKVGSGQAGVRKKMDSEVQRMMNALGLSGRYYITCGEIGGGPAERTGHRERDTHIAHETRSTMGEPSKR